MVKLQCCSPEEKEAVREENKKMREAYKAIYQQLESCADIDRQDDEAVEEYV